MVGPGTGLAPFRSFILQRHLQAQHDGSSCGPMVLYFGCRRSDQDYLYGQVGAAGWAAAAAAVVLQGWLLSYCVQEVLQGHCRVAAGYCV
jgi:hypothetical protein